MFLFRILKVSSKWCDRLGLEEADSICFIKSNRIHASKPRPFPSIEIKNWKRWKMKRSQFFPIFFTFLSQFDASGRDLGTWIRLPLWSQIEITFLNPGHSHQIEIKKWKRWEKNCDFFIFHLFQFFISIDGNGTGLEARIQLLKLEQIE